LSAESVIKTNMTLPPKVIFTTNAKIFFFYSWLSHHINLNKAALAILKLLTVKTNYAKQTMDATP